MPTITWTTENGGAFSYQHFVSYDLTATTNIGGGLTELRFSYRYGTGNKVVETLILTVSNYSDLGGGRIGGTLVGFEALRYGETAIISNDLSVDLASATADGELSWTDIIASGVTMIGSDGTDNDLNGFTDEIITGAGNDNVSAGTGYDYIEGSIGNDTINGGAGHDILSYQWLAPETGGVIFNLAAGTVQAVNGSFTDTISGIEGARGTMADDTLIGRGGTANDVFIGYGGDDTIVGGGGNEDLLRYDKDFGLGGDTGINVDLTRGVVEDSFNDIDVVTGIELVDGTQFADIFRDSADADNGFNGGHSDDIFIFRGGNNWANGGSGADTFIIEGNSGGVSIGDFNVHEGDRIIFEGANSFNDITVSSDGGTASVSFGGVGIELINVGAGSITADYFEFSMPNVAEVPGGTPPSKASPTDGDLLVVCYPNDLEI